MSASILVLEDDETTGRLIRAQLKAAGHRVRVFAHAGTAIDEIDDGATFDLYVLDVTMPVGELHGLALARMIKTRFSDARIIFVTGNPVLSPRLTRNLGRSSPSPSTSSSC
jgi:CheY-like chemotaxis protein